MATPGRNRPTLLLLSILTAPAVWLERTPGWWRLALLLLYGIVVAVPMAFLLRAASLRELPDVGDPFDVAAFRANDVPDGENALILYDRALEAIRASGTGPGADLQWLIQFGQTESDIPRVFLNGRAAAWRQRALGLPSEIAHLVRLGEGLDLWRRGTDRARSAPGPSHGEFLAKSQRDLALRGLARLALRKAALLEDDGDLAGAWGWYRAALRSSRHVGMRGGAEDRGLGAAILADAAESVERWAADPRVDAALLRRALRDAIEADEMTPPDSDAIKIEYLAAMRTLERPAAGADHAAREALIKEVDESLWYARIPEYHKARWFLRNEPERSRRVARLVFANWLAHCDLPPHLRPALVDGPPPRVALAGPGVPMLAASVGMGTPPGWGGGPIPSPLQLFLAGPTAPESARAPAPEAIGRWYETAPHAQLAIPPFDLLDQAFAQDREARDALLLTLARELYFREHGRYSESDAALVGAYLKRAPFVEPSPKLDGPGDEPEGDPSLP
jgi:hypothetical protein